MDRLYATRRALHLICPDALVFPFNSAPASIIIVNMTHLTPPFRYRSLAHAGPDCETETFHASSFCPLVLRTARVYQGSIVCQPGTSREFTGWRTDGTVPKATFPPSRCAWAPCAQCINVRIRIAPYWPNRLSR